MLATFSCPRYVRKHWIIIIIIIVIGDRRFAVLLIIRRITDKRGWHRVGKLTAGAVMQKRLQKQKE